MRKTILGFQRHTISCSALTDRRFPSPRQFQLNEFIAPGSAALQPPPISHQGLVEVYLPQCISSLSRSFPLHFQRRVYAWLVFVDNGPNSNLLTVAGWGAGLIGLETSISSFSFWASRPTSKRVSSGNFAGHKSCEGTTGGVKNLARAIELLESICPTRVGWSLSLRVFSGCCFSDLMVLVLAKEP